MSKPVHQHFIPKSYLNNFAKKDQGKAFIYAKRSDDDTIKKLSTRDICVDKNLYTLPTSYEAKKYDLEHFYADNIDAVFPEVYEILKNRDITEVGFDTRLKIVTTALSLYFRTPKFLNEENEFFKKVVDAALKNVDAEEITVEIFGETITIKRAEVDELTKERKENNRIKFLQQHLLSYEKLVQSKLADNISVYHIIDESEFITSDNPVIIRPYVDVTAPDYNLEEYLALKVNPFDASNMIHLPIDAKTILTILPATKEGFNTLLARTEIKSFDTLIYNHDIEKSAENWILGSEEGIARHISDQQQYQKQTPENLKELEDYQRKVLALVELHNLHEQHGAKNDLVQSKLAEMLNDKYIKEDTNFMRFAEVLLKARYK